MLARGASACVRRLCGVADGSRAADVAQLAERVLGKDEVTSSILVIGSSNEYVSRVVGPGVATNAIGRDNDNG